ncbi:MAG TPA: NADH-quinone oxidoreductase subunit L [Verrucomicrobiota bacterium]|nr:NADH-quinone oxidoreductase subunit L [Verrucomicrobiota bacterium]HNU51536.1 NADH-quinone oxidoreductase subunit L [Verrucomicrobiota bacterium]
MEWIRDHLWWIPVLPLLAAGVSALLPRGWRRMSAGLAIGSLAAALVLSVLALGVSLGLSGMGSVNPAAVNFRWLDAGLGVVRLGWVLDPLGACMLVMVSLVGLLIFSYSVGYMAEDENFTRFFCFLALFAGAMLGLVMANSLLLLFACWELVGLASYLLIGFWYQKPEAAAAARKAFITTRIGDVAFFLGLVWWYAESGTVLFYDTGAGCLEPRALDLLSGRTTILGMATATGVALLLFVGAIGKSGQVPLHVWLPDAMEGPTPVSALIHAATMVAAGVFLVARVYPLMALGGGDGPSAALQAVTWVGAVTAVFAATVAVAQTDIKRVLAYSTVSQLGFMMLGLGTGGVAVGMFHLLTHAFFKALLFLGAGSVIHGVGGEQDIRRMGGLRRWMPVTFATYAIGMMALAGVPVVFSGFWSKDEILHAAHAWPVSQVPFCLALAGALLTAFYMTRQMAYVFFGAHRGAGKGEPAHPPHESPRLMTVPLGVLAAGAVGLGFLGTPAWPGLESYWTGRPAEFDPGRLLAPEAVSLMLLSAVVVAVGMGLGWWLYGRRPITQATEPDRFAQRFPATFRLWQRKYGVDEFYAATVVRAHGLLARWGDWVDRWIWGGLVLAAGLLAVGAAWVSRFLDEWGVNLGFDRGCGGLRLGGWRLALFQDGRVQGYLRALAMGVVLLVLLLTWGTR